RGHREHDNRWRAQADQQPACPVRWSAPDGDEPAHHQSGPYPRKKERRFAGESQNRPEWADCATRPATLEKERNPAVSGIPDQDREENRQSNQTGGIGMG